MHERTQRSLSRLVFVVCCALPTCFTLVAIIVTWTPWHHQRKIRIHEEQLSKSTGLLVRIGDYRTLSPSMVRLSQVKMIDPETETPIVNVRQIDWSRDHGQTLILMQQPELYASTFPAAWAMIHDRFLRQPDQVQEAVRFAASDLTIHSQRGTTITLSDVDAWIEPSTNRDSVQATIQCLMAGSVHSNPISISVTRDRRDGIPQTSWTLQTGDTALPCSALQDCFNGRWSGLGPQATFRGTLRGWLPKDSYSNDSYRPSFGSPNRPNRSGERLELDLSGSTFANVSLDRLFEKQQHRLSGLATIQLDRCRLDRDRRLVDIAGSIRTTDGLIGRSLLAAAAKHLDFTVGLPDGEGDIPFDCLSMHFSLLGSELKIHGACRKEINHGHFPVGVVMGMAGVPIAASSSRSLPALRLMSVLAPSHSQWIPLAQQNQELLWILLPPEHGLPGQPLTRSPQNMAMPHESTNPSASRIRSARAYDGTRPLIGQPR